MMNRKTGEKKSPHHRRGQSLNGISKDVDENLDLFSTNHRSLSLSCSDDSSDISVKMGRLSLGSIKSSNNRVDDLLSFADAGKNDYDWLLTPPATPLGSESKSALAAPKTTTKVRSVSTTKASRLSASQSESNRSSRPTRSSSVTRPSISSSQYNRSSSILNTSSASVSSNIRPSSPLNRSPSTARPSTLSSRPTLSRSSTPSKLRSAPRSSSIEKTRPPQNSRSPTPSSRPQTPAKSTATSTSTRSNSRPSTPTRRSPLTSVSVTSGSSTSAGHLLSSGRMSASRSRPSSPGPRVKPPQQAMASPDIRTSLPGRPVSAGRSRPGVTAAPNGSSEAAGPVNTRRRNGSPVVTRGRLTEPSARGRVNANTLAADRPDKRKASHVLDTITRKLGKSSTAGTDSTGFGRTMSKNSLDMAIRHMDIRNGKGSSRPLSGTIIYPPSIRSSASRNQPIAALNGSESINSNGSLQSEETSENGSNMSGVNENGNEADEGRYLAELSQVDIYESSRYDALLLREDVKNTNWLHSVDDDASDQGLIFDSGFEPPPEPFGPL